MPRRTNSRKSRGQYFTCGNRWMGISLYVVNGQNDIAVARKLRRGRGTVVLYAPATWCVQNNGKLLLGTSQVSMVQGFRTGRRRGFGQ